MESVRYLMRVYSKTVKILELSRDELDMLTQMVDEAKAGHTVNYSERDIGRGQYFGINIIQGQYPDDIYNLPKGKR